MPSLTRRHAFGLLPVALFYTALLPTALRAETCDKALPGLRLCDVWGWARGTAADGLITLTHATGITATIRLETGLDAEGETWANWEQGQAPMRSRGPVLDTWFSEIDGRFAAGSVWRPRYENHLIVAMTGYVGEGAALVVTTRATAADFDETHRTAHEELCAAIRLDLPT
ncbi:MAG: hypothetical protein EAZ40_04530 [Rhodobacterales bacterium]|nr:MAG: hypothetical protein EAZ40_04530 [Rhodobacterales bacterium]